MSKGNEGGQARGGLDEVLVALFWARGSVSILVPSCTQAPEVEEGSGNLGKAAGCLGKPWWPAYLRGDSFSKELEKGWTRLSTAGRTSEEAFPFPPILAHLRVCSLRSLRVSAVMGTWKFLSASELTKATHDGLWLFVATLSHVSHN